MTHRSANVVHATSQDFDGTSGARTVLVNCPQRPQWNSDGSPARTHNGLPECFSIPRPVRTRTQRDMHYLTRAVPSAVSRAVSSATVRTRTQRGMDYLLLCNILSLAPVLWRGSGMLTEIRRWHAKWPAPRSTACLVWASSEGQLGVLRQVPGMGSSEGRLGVLRQVPGELDAVDDAVGCGNGHHLDVLGGLDGILALAHLMLGEPSGRQSLEITSCWGNHRGGNQ